MLSTRKPMCKLNWRTRWFWRGSKRSLTIPKAYGRNFSMKYYDHITPSPLYYEGNSIHYGVRGICYIAHINWNTLMAVLPIWVTGNQDKIRICYRLADEFKQVTHIQEFGAKHKASKRYNSKVMPREMREGDLVLKQVVIPAQQGTL